MPIEEEAPKGVCRVCNMVKIKRGGETICPNCDTKSEPSGLTNTFEDPGHAAMEKVIASNMPNDLPKVKEITMMNVLSHIPKLLGQSMYNSLIFAFEAVEKIPMPNNMKSVKKLLKIKHLLNELMEESNV